MTSILLLLLMSTAEIINPIPPETKLWVTDDEKVMKTSDGNRFIFRSD